jgi:hypothetical protein
MAKQRRVRWAADPEPHDYPAAAAYLGLCASHHIDEDADIPGRLVDLPA